MGTLSWSYGKPRAYLGLPGTCHWCGDKLRHEESADGRGGYRDNGAFCTLRCGYQWAVRRIGADGRFVSINEVPRVLSAPRTQETP